MLMKEVEQLRQTVTRNNDQIDTLKDKVDHEQKRANDMSISNNRKLEEINNLKLQIQSLQTKL
jgi:chromosome segregation ATPase